MPDAAPPRDADPGLVWHIWDKAEWRCTICGITTMDDAALDGCPGKKKETPDAG